MTVRMGKVGPTILTNSGEYFDLLAPAQSPIKAVDIAAALSNICRFGGHTEQFYSVAQHCVLVSFQVPREHAMAGLLHDAAEAYVGDMVAPLKKLLPEYKKLEIAVEEAIAATFGIQFPYDPCIKAADIRALFFERKHLMPWHTGDDWADEEKNRDPIIGDLVALSPAEARASWMARFIELGGKP